MAMKPFYRSRKFVLLGLDGLLAVVMLTIIGFVEPEMALAVQRTFVVLTAAVIAVIVGIAIEDGAALLAGTHYSQVAGDGVLRDKVGDDSHQFGVVHGNVSVYNRENEE